MKSRRTIGYGFSLVFIAVVGLVFNIAFYIGLAYLIAVVIGLN